MPLNAFYLGVTSTEPIVMDSKVKSVCFFTTHFFYFAEFQEAQDEGFTVKEEPSLSDNSLFHDKFNPSDFDFDFAAPDLLSNNYNLPLASPLKMTMNEFHYGGESSTQSQDYKFPDGVISLNPTQENDPYFYGQDENQAIENLYNENW